MTTIVVKNFSNISNIPMINNTTLNLCSSNDSSSPQQSISEPISSKKTIIKNNNNNINNTNNSNSKKKNPTVNEWKLVKQHFQHAKTRNLEQDLLTNEKHLIEYRNKIYKQAKNDGITPYSNDKQRLNVVQDVVEYLFNNVKPPNTYTKNTDIRHFKEVAALAVNYCKKQNKQAPITLIMSCWFHDIERFIPCTKCDYLPEIVDKYRKQLIHPQTSARVAMTILEGSPIRNEEKQRIYDIIVQHDKPIDKKIEFLDEIYLNRPSNDILWELQVLMDADAMAFFTHTIKEFINYKMKKNTSEWIWTRILTNIKRLRPKLRIEAITNIKNLTNELRKNMGYSNFDIEQILHEVSIIDEQGTTDDTYQPFSPSVSNSQLVPDRFQRVLSSPILPDNNIENTSPKPKSSISNKSNKL